MSSHNFHWHDDSELTVHWSEPGQCIRFHVEGDDVCIHAHGLEREARLRRAFDAFQREMQREPIENREAAE
jgi:hypothetical protein